MVPVVIGVILLGELTLNKDHGDSHGDVHDPMKLCYSYSVQRLFKSHILKLNNYQRYYNFSIKLYCQQNTIYIGIIIYMAFSIL